MAENMYAIYRQTLSTTTGSITFNNIPQNFTDLKIMHSVRDNTTPASQYHSNNIYLRLNGDSSSLYSGTIFYSSSSAVSTARNIAGNSYIYVGTVLNANGVANSFGSGEVYITGYSSGKFKQVLGETSNVSNISTLDGAYQVSTTGLYRSRNPITSISLIPGSGSFVANSTFTLYGILKPGNAPKATGGQITSDDKYWYHAFKSVGSSNFIPNQDLSVEVLCVGGGGGGGNGFGAGGGGGGVVYGTTPVLKAGVSYSATVGAGAVAQTLNNSLGNLGASSSFGSFVSALGGGGGGSVGGAGRNGASGGGGGGSGSSAVWPQGSGVYGQGFNGGTGISTSGAGGGGAGGASTSPTTTLGGNGGNGTAAFTNFGIATGTGVLVASAGYLYSYYSAGAPGNGTGGMGALGIGGPAIEINAPDNTGASSSGDNAKAGGSGVVIVRYPL
jgi:hypothetical protein